MSAASSRGNDLDVIRPPTPRLTRAALVGLALVAGGSFASGVAREVAGRLTASPPAEAAAPAAAPDLPAAALPAAP
ncbi:MAG: hypothetical protein JWQ29_197, partial [Phenylobacterium sp.]|nr:hypothetical protein [Phenylobacterium sp.]